MDGDKLERFWKEALERLKVRAGQAAASECPDCHDTRERPQPWFGPPPDRGAHVTRRERLRRRTASREAGPRWRHWWHSSEQWRP